MALRVLLADESSTIKKAIQMALSEYGVEVKSVPSGLDVLAVSHTFRPDVVFADVLLTKKNGYEVCHELKSDPMTRTVPVILMWSSFMQIDQTQVKSVKADGILEKPFDTEALRNLIERHVPKANSFPLHNILNHPPLPDFAESDTMVRQKNEYMSSQSQHGNSNSPQGMSSPSQTMQTRSQNPSVPPTNSQPTSNARPQTPPTERSVFDSPSQEPQSPRPKTPPPVSNRPPTPVEDEPLSKMVIDDVDEDFVFNDAPQKSTPASGQDQGDEWSAGSPGQFVIETESFGDFEEVTVVNSKNSPSSAPDLQKRIKEQVSSYLQDSPVAQKRANEAMPSIPKGVSQFDEQILREEIRQMAERICWQIIPEITEKVVREELNKLLQGIEKHT